jgi:hypothetical protein
MGFQASPAFQSSPAFQPQFIIGCGGHSEPSKKKDHIFYDIYTGRKAPKVVEDAIKEVINSDLQTKEERKKELRRELSTSMPNIESKLMLLYIQMLEEATLARQAAIKEYNASEAASSAIMIERNLRIQEEDDQMIILLLLNSY